MFLRDCAPSGTWCPAGLAPSLLVPNKRVVLRSKRAALALRLGSWRLVARAMMKPNLFYSNLRVTAGLRDAATQLACSTLHIMSGKAETK